MASPSVLLDTSPQVLISGSGQERGVSQRPSSVGKQADPAVSQAAPPEQAGSSPCLVSGQRASPPLRSPGQPALSLQPSVGEGGACSPPAEPRGAKEAGPGGAKETEPGGAKEAGSGGAKEAGPGGAKEAGSGGAKEAGPGGAKEARRPLKRGRSRRGRSRANRAGRGAVDRDTLVAEGHPLAPPNDTDFLMDDHDAQPESDLLFDRYGQPTPRESPAGPQLGCCAAPPGLAAWPLLEPSIARLIAEHIQMESHIEALESRIAVVRQRRDSASDASDEEMQQGEVHMAPETATKIRVLQAEIRLLEEENAALREFNDRIIDERGGGSVASFTSDSESDSSSSSSASSASSRSSSSSSDSSSSGSESAPDSPRMPASV